jgi:hypothetical protein
LWAARGVTATDAAGGDPLAVVFTPGSDAEHGYYDDASGTIYVNVDLDADPSARAIVIAHELGHAFGLYHVAPDLRASVMNPGNLTVAPTDADAAQVAALWGACR